MAKITVFNETDKIFETVAPADSGLTFPASAHNHDDLYFTETETTTLLSGKANSTHTHTIADLPTTATLPVMDGIANAGSATTLAKSDHVHPVDTSRAAASHDHAASNITSGVLDIARVPTGTTSTTVCIGNDARLSDARTPLTHSHDDLYFTETETTTLLSGKANSSHAHGNVTTDGKLGTTADLPLITGSSGVIQAGSFGNTPKTFCEGSNLVKLAKEMGGTAYKTLLDINCLPTIDLNFFDYINEINGAPPGFTFSRASNATYFDSLGILRTAGNDVLRHDFDPATGRYLGILSEQQATNLVTQSSRLTGFTAYRGVKTLDSAIAPDGTLTACKLTESTDTGLHYLSKDITVNDNTVYTASMFVYAPDRQYFYISINLKSGAMLYLHYSLITMTHLIKSAGIITYVVKNCGNGWYRVTVTFNSSSGVNAFIRLNLGVATDTAYSYTGDGTSSIIYWGVQLEIGYHATSYIPTSDSEVTRVGDSLSLIVTGLNLINEKEGTFLVESEVSEIVCDNTVAYRVFQLDDGTSNNRHYIDRYYDTSVQPLALNGFRCVSTVSNSSQAAFNVSSTSTLNRCAFTYKSNNFSCSVNGALVISDTSGSVPSGLTTLIIGASRGAIGQYNGCISKFTYFPRQLNNEQVVMLPSA